jgi:hypothetical protein
MTVKTVYRKDVGRYKVIKTPVLSRLKRYFYQKYWFYCVFNDGDYLG